MATSVFDLFKIGIGPSSSHTVGPMVAARRFALALESAGALSRVDHVSARLHGSLGATGRGHASDRAVILGLMGEEPATVDPDAIERLVALVTGERRLALLGRREVAFDPRLDLAFDPVPLPFHPNALRLRASGAGQ